MTFNLFYHSKSSTFLTRTLPGNFQRLKAIDSPCLLHFTLEMKKPYFASCFFLSKYTIYWLNLVFKSREGIEFKLFLLIPSKLVLTFKYI